ncbi:unnamed protein product [Cylindrotheca closterium]|uniref:CCT domain-containing protein n=1 Tax=Cylindrotheca closterium TaxID=2856 RepID=A0AAD2JGE8_9STRA|nr:unnamed protein product [Cylindrotheca closterium]
MASKPHSIINIANSMFSARTLGAQAAQNNTDDRLDAAHALLGVSPASSNLSPSLQYFGSIEEKQSNSEPAQSHDSSIGPQRLRSNSTGLEALALLATEEQDKMEPVEIASKSVPNRPLAATILSSSSDEDSEAMPPPRPRPRALRTRRRSVSNPEGMEKWSPEEDSRLHFVLPASILEEELAEASAAMKAKEEEMAGQNEESNADEEEDDDEEEVLNEDELLRRARSRLLEDLSQGNLNGEKGVLTLPHSLEKYKQVYNKNGRIGIYTPAERSAIIKRFQSKRTRRVWNKKIRYNCRKSLADRRMRVKGRFVKRSTEQQARSRSNTIGVTPILEADESKFVSPESSIGETAKDAEMPDIADTDARFCPTKYQPYRRTRRHTIT